MMRSIAEALSFRNRSWQPGIVQEQRAKANAKDINKAGRLETQRTNYSTPESELEGIGSGKPLDADIRKPMEAHFGRDFSDVRVHANSEVADDVGAKAFTHGRDIAFGSGEFAPDTANGQSLIAHELTHAVQQTNAGNAALQMDSKKEKAGLGSAPPKEPFIVATKPAPEDGFALFAFDDATLTATAMKKLKAMTESLKTPVAVEVHGYASEEGDGEYNLNLSAHRGASVKKYLETILPAGSQVTIVAHGVTTGFGDSADNRRVGVSISPGVSADTSSQLKKKDEEKWSLDPTLGAKSPVPRFRLLDPLPKPGLFLDPNGGIGPLAPKPLQLLPPLQLTPSLLPPTSNDIDWYSIRGKFTMRGLMMSDRDASGIEQHWHWSYNWFRNFVPHDLAVKGANAAVPFVVDDTLARENPNAVDRANKEFQIMFPDEKHIVIPMTDVLDWLRKKAKIGDPNSDWTRF